MKKLIVIDGPDGIGKSTQVRILQEKLGAHLFIQPNDNNCVGFLRHEVKNNPVYEPFERQLLHTVSHTVDAYTQFGKHECLVMDRSHSSTYAYGKTQDIPEDKIDLLMKIHYSVYQDALKDFDVRIIFLDRDTKYQAGDTDEFEKMLSWERIRLEFRGLAFKMMQKNLKLFNTEEKFSVLSLNGIEKDAITKKLLEFVS